MQMLEHRARRELEIARAQLVGQLLRICRQVAERAEFDPLVSRCRHLVEEAGIGGLLRVVGEPHTPGVGCGSDEDGAHWSGAFQLSDGLRYGRWIFFQSA